VSPDCVCIFSSKFATDHLLYHIENGKFGVGEKTQFLFVSL